MNDAGNWFTYGQAFYRKEAFEPVTETTVNFSNPEHFCT